MEKTAKRILVLDDDAAILDMLAMILSDAGYQVLALPEGGQLFEIVKSFAPDLVLMDVQLAWLDGRQLCRALKEQAQTAGLPVILISAASGMQSCLLEKGAPDDFIAKPFDLDHLLAKVDFLLAA